MSTLRRENIVTPGDRKPFVAHAVDSPCIDFGRKNIYFQLGAVLYALARDLNAYGWRVYAVFCSYFKSQRNEAVWFFAGAFAVNFCPHLSVFMNSHATELCEYRYKKKANEFQIFELFR